MEQTPPDVPQVSGFYGPGAWAAWVIMMVASWIPIIRGHYTHKLHFIGYALYTNWAAVDFIRQSHRGPGYDDFSAVEERARLDNTVASIAVLNVGIFQAFGQMLFCVCTGLHPGVMQLKLMRVGTLFPLYIILFGSLLIAGNGWYDYGYMFKTNILYVLLVVHALGFSFFIAWRRFRFHRDVVIILVHLLVLFDVLATSNVYLNDAIWIRYGSVAASGGAVPAARCYFVPCASQGIGEWDQAFSLLVALFLFLYEFGSGMVRIVRRGTEVVLNTGCTPLLQTMGSILESLVHRVQTAFQSVETGSSLREDFQNEIWGSGYADEQV